MKTGALFTALCLAAMLLAEGTVNATPAHDLIFTENSPTSLTATLDGSSLTVTNTGADAWTVTLPSTLTITGGASQQGVWTEPENISLFNTTQNLSDSTSVLVSSDGPIPPALPSETPIGQGSPDGTSEIVGAMTDGLPLNEAFFDKAQTAEASVPDGASTAMLLGIALLGIEGLRRRFRAA